MVEPQLHSLDRGAENDRLDEVVEYLARLLVDLRANTAKLGRDVSAPERAARARARPTRAATARVLARFPWDFLSVFGFC